MKVETETGDKRMLFFTLWIFATLNYVYADVVTLFDKSVPATLSQTALLGAAVLVETAIAMVLLSRVLKYKANRWANIVVGAINTVAVLASLLVVTPAFYYLFFGVIEIATTLVIIWKAWTWRNPLRPALHRIADRLLKLSKIGRVILPR
jgi:Family of unknown function (DUF6326)